MRISIAELFYFKCLQHPDNTIGYVTARNINIYLVIMKAINKFQ